MAANAPLDPTFRNFDQKQGANYAQHRRGYPAQLYELILAHHKSTGGQLNTVVDVGCGPGIATREIAPHFDRAVGLDPSDGMISTARSMTESDKIDFKVSSAEEMSGLAEGSVDLVTAATAAHWFDMSRFWPRAAEVLKPGGTVAIWTIGSSQISPSTPNYEKIQAAIDEIDDKYLKPYYLPGNLIGRSMYATLVLPWDVEPPVLKLDKTTFFRKDWGPDNDVFPSITGINMEQAEKLLGTTSPVLRWREANAELVGTEKDVIRMMTRAIERYQREAGVADGKVTIDGRVSAVLLMFKKMM